MLGVMEVRERISVNRDGQTKHDWDDSGDGDDKNRLQMTNDDRDDANDSQALSSGEGSVACHKDRPSLRNASVLCDGKPISV